MQATRPKWLLPITALVLGIGMLAAEWVGGDLRSGLLVFGVMVAFGALILLGGRSETIRGLRGDGGDERFRQIDVNATAVSGIAVILAILVAFAVDVARGGNGFPYSWLGAIAGVSYIAAVVFFRLRG